MSFNVSSDCTDSRIQFPSGNWTHGVNETSTSLALGIATATFDFNGTFISVLGSVTGAPNVTLLTYFIDNEVFSAQFSNSTSNIIYSSPMLPSGSHTLRLTSNNSKTRLAIEGMVFTTELPPAAPVKHTGLIVGIVLGVTVLFLALGLFAFLWRKRRRQESQQNNFSSGELRVSLPASKKAFTSPNRGQYGISFFMEDVMSTESLPRPNPNHSKHTSQQSGWM